MVVLNVRVPPDLHARLDAEARRLNVTRSKLVRRLIATALEDSGSERPSVSCADLMGDLIGSVSSGIDDLATNPQHLKEAIIQDRQRGRDRHTD